ncbi:MAG: hypothetical protein ACLP7F_03885 [Acidimicrobiales bacterium]
MQRSKSEAKNLPSPAIAGLVVLKPRRVVGVLCAVLGLSGLVTMGTATASAPPAATVFVAQAGSNVGCGSARTGAQALGTVTTYPLGAAGDVAPKVTLAKDMNGPSALAFDSSGNLWVANSGNDTMLEFTKGELSQAHAAPSVTISSDASHDLTGPDGLAFGPAGDMWVASSGTNMLIEYTKAELAKSGTPTPRAIVPAPTSATTSPQPDGLAFDPSGDLWVTSSDGAATGTPTFNVVAEFTKAELAKAHPVASVTISSDASGSLYLPGIPVFAPSGALWVPNGTNNTVVEYTRSELTKSGSPAPYVTISANASLSNLNEPGSLAFDPSGDMWVLNATTVAEFNKGQLTKSGSPAPMRTIAGPKTAMDCPSSIVIQP